jgi:DNA-binding transcriptional ArsR family regulator
MEYDYKKYEQILKTLTDETMLKIIDMLSSGEL